MRKILSLCAAGIFALFGQAARVSAQAPEREAKAPEAKAPDKCDPATSKEESSVTEHSIKIGGQTIPCKATASTTLLKNDKGESTGLMYSVAYTRSDVKDVTTRPVAFLYRMGLVGSAEARTGNFAQYVSDQPTTVIVRTKSSIAVLTMLSVLP
jgi:carboxypeptidase C (cathepsin A)